MDAQAYLIRHGWRGAGHSLDASTSNRGLKKPLLVSKKIDVLGIGINKHDVVADQWWMKAFDASLKDFGTGKQSLLASVREHGVRNGGLYGRFVKGEGVAGTYGRDVFGREVGGVVAGKEEVVGEKKRRRRREGIVGMENKEGKKARRAAKKAKRDARARVAASDTSAVSTPAVTDSEKTESKKSRRSTKSDKASKRKDKTVDGLDAEKKAEYERRAKEKGLTLEDYFTRRLAKNAAARKG